MLSTKLGIGEYSEPYHGIFIIRPHLCDVCVDQRLQIVPATVNYELSASTKSCSWEQDMFGE